METVIIKSKDPVSLKTGFYNIKLDLTDRKNVLEKCDQFFGSNSIHTIFFLNAHCFNIAQKNDDYSRAINNSDLLLNDGIGIKIASLLSGIRLKENLNGTDLIPEILVLAAEKKKKIFLLGGANGIAERAAGKIKEMIPRAEITGYHSGYFSEKEEKKVLEKVNSCRSELLVLGMGVPRQELWAIKNKSKLTGTKIIIGGGAILDFISGNVKRAPLWMRKMNIEWVYRLINEPGRLWRRYVIGNALFLYHIIRLKLI